MSTMQQFSTNIVVTISWSHASLSYKATLATPFVTEFISDSTFAALVAAAVPLWLFWPNPCLRYCSLSPMRIPFCLHLASISAFLCAAKAVKAGQYAACVYVKSTFPPNSVNNCVAGTWLTSASLNLSFSLVRGSMKGVMSLKKPQTNHGTRQRETVSFEKKTRNGVFLHDNLFHSVDSLTIDDQRSSKSLWIMCL